MTQCSAVANAVGVVERSRANPGRVGVIVVGTIRKARCSARLVERDLAGKPGRAWKPVGDDGTVVAMNVIAKILVVFQLAKIGQQFLEAPLIIAHLGPGIVVLGHTSQKHFPVDGARAPSYFTAGHQHFRSVVRGFADKLPVVVADHNIDFRRITVFDFLRRCLKRVA